MRPTTALSVLLFSTLGLAGPIEVERDEANAALELLSRGVGVGGCNVDDCIAGLPEGICWEVVPPWKRAPAECPEWKWRTCDCNCNCVQKSCSYTRRPVPNNCPNYVPPSYDG